MIIKKLYMNKKKLVEKNFRINSKLHEIFLLKQNKIALDGTKIRKRLKDPNEKFKTLPLGIEEFILRHF